MLLWMNRLIVDACLSITIRNEISTSHRILEEAVSVTDNNIALNVPNYDEIDSQMLVLYKECQTSKEKYNLIGNPIIAAKAYLVQVELYILNLLFYPENDCFNLSVPSIQDCLALSKKYLGKTA